MASSILPIPFRYVVVVLLLLIATATQSTLAFVVAPINTQRLQYISSSSSSSSKCSHTFTTKTREHNQVIAVAPLSATNNNNNVVEITFPTPEEAASMGIRDWPQQFHDKDWAESITEGQIATRYVLSGKGRVTIDYYDGDNLDIRQRTNQRIYAGTLVEVDGEAELFWEVDDDGGASNGIIVLTPSYEEGGKLLLVAGALVVFCAGLIAGSTGF